MVGFFMAGFTNTKTVVSAVFAWPMLLGGKFSRFKSKLRIRCGGKTYDEKNTPTNKQKYVVWFHGISPLSFLLYLVSWITRQTLTSVW